MSLRSIAKDIGYRTPWVGLRLKYRDLQKSMLRLKVHSERPPRGLLYKHAGVQIPILPIHMMEVYLICKFSSVMTTVTTNLKNEIFRRGLVWRPAFVLKCEKCGFGLQHEKDQCPKCGGMELRRPKLDEIDRLDSFIDKCNQSDQSLIEVFKECEYDLDIIDDCYIVLVRDYITDDEGNIEYTLNREIIRGDPLIMRMVTDEDGELGKKMWTCIEHRNIESPKEDVCSECGRKMHEVHYVAVQGGSHNKPQKRYIKGEVIHASKYFPTITYGFPPVISIWKEISILQHMNNYINDYYQHMRMPRGVVMVQTTNTRQTFDSWDVIQERVEENPAYLPLIPIEQMPDGTTQGKAEFVRFMDNLMEMQYIQAKDDLRQRISALYGVTNVLMNDPAGAGGLNNEGLMIKVTDRSIESGQGLWNEKILPILCREFGINDYVLNLRPNEEEDEMEELQIDQLRIANAQQMHMMGFTVELDEDGKPTKFSGEAQDPQEMGGGGLGGLLGGSQSTPPLAGAGTQQSPHAMRNFNRSLVETPVLVNEDVGIPGSYINKSAPKSRNEHETHRDSSAISEDKEDK